MSATTFGGPCRQRKRRQPTASSAAGHKATNTPQHNQHHYFKNRCIATIPLLSILFNNIQYCNAFSSLPSSQQPPFQNPSTPEETIQNQLYHYQHNNLPQVYQYNSPGNKQVTGSFTEFERQVQIPPYDLLVEHERADVLMEIIPEGMPNNEEDGILDVSCCLVCIRPKRTGRSGHSVWFWWEMSKVRLDELELEDVDVVDEITTGDVNNGWKWMVDCIMPDFEDLDFEAQSLSIDDFDGEDDGENDDEVTIYWDFDA